LIEVDTIMSIHYFEFGADFNFSGETHDYWELVYIDRGKARVSANSVLLKLSQGEIIFHRPGEVHAIASDPTDPPTVFIITFRSGSEYMSFFSGRRMTVPTPLRRYISEMISDGQEAYILTDDSPYERELVRREDGLIGSEQLIIMNLEMLLIKLIRSCSLPKLKNENTKNYDPLTTRVVEMLNNSVYGRITVDAISKELGFSRTHISSEFKKCCGKTISEYMTELKVSEAKYLIRKRLYTVSQISDFLCYDNPHYFFRVFKKETGMTPRQYALSVSFPDKFAKKT
jgi:AraC-like DNA-binding protein